MYGWESGALVAALVLALYIWRKKRFSLFKDLGVPGPEPSLLFGHLLEIRRRGAAVLFEEWIKKYGNIVGFYIGAHPFLLINDREILKKVQIADFHNFSTRGLLTGVTNFRAFGSKTVSAATGSRWKELRTILSPAFSPNKLSLMAGPLSQCADTLIEVLKEKSAAGESVEVTLPIKRASIDTMLKAGFGVDLDIQRSPPGGTMEYVATGVKDFLRTVPLHGIPFLSNCFPEFDLVWTLMIWFTSLLMIPLLKRVAMILLPLIEKRRLQQSPTATDFLQLLLRRQTSGNPFTHDSQAPDARSKLPFTKEEADANAILFFVSGLEGATILMSVTLYLLGLHPVIQDKVRSEVLDVLKKEGSFTYKATQKMTYLDMVLNESMRLYTSVVGFATRLALEDYEVNGIKIPKGVSVMVPLTYLHLDPEVWHHPERFDPERFSPQNISLIDKVSFQPFGLGPRQCIGRNFALLQARLMMCKFIAAFRISVDEEHHKEVLKMKSSLLGATLPSGVWLKLENINT